MNLRAIGVLITLTVAPEDCPFLLSIFLTVFDCYWTIALHFNGCTSYRFKTETLLASFTRMRFTRHQVTSCCVCNSTRFAHNHPDSKVHGANMGSIWRPTGPRWAPCWPHELCYPGSSWLLGNSADWSRLPWHWFNIKMLSYQYRNGVADKWNGPSLPAESTKFGIKEFWGMLNQKKKIGTYWQNPFIFGVVYDIYIFLAATKNSMNGIFCPSVRPSLRPTVCPSVRLSICHTFLTMFPSSYHHEIFRSYHQGPE